MNGDLVDELRRLVRVREFIGRFDCSRDVDPDEQTELVLSLLKAAGVPPR